MLLLVGTYLPQCTGGPTESAAFAKAGRSGRIESGPRTRAASERSLLPAPRSAFASPERVALQRTCRLPFVCRTYIRAAYPRVLSVVCAFLRVATFIGNGPERWDDLRLPFTNYKVNLDGN